MTTRDDDGVDSKFIVELPFKYRATVIFIAVMTFIILVLQVSQVMRG